MKKSFVLCTILLLSTSVFFSCDSDSDSSGPLSSQNRIIDFMVSGVPGIIIGGDDDVISVILPENTVLTSLAPVITTSNNSSVNPASGSSQNFTNPTDYVVTAEDGSMRTYRVTVSTNIHSFNFENKMYEIVKEEMTWEEAVAFATSRGGFLAEINNASEQGAIFLELVNNANIVLPTLRLTEVWLGGNDRATDGVWILDGSNDGIGEQFWDGGIDGVPVEGFYNNWGNNEPDGTTSQNELSMLIEDSPRNERGKWNDRSNTQTLFFVIEYN